MSLFLSNLKFQKRQACQKQEIAQGKNLICFEENLRRNMKFKFN